MRKFIYLFIFFFCLNITNINAQVDRTNTTIWSYFNGLEYELKAGINIGGTSPIPLPREIRSINSYSPNLAITFGTEITKWFNESKKIGAIIGLRFESKTMSTKATVKNYGMEIIGDGGEIVKGMWTGGVKTKVDNSYLTLPIMFAYSVSPRWKLKLGPYFSYLLSGDFYGHVYDGYLREGDPTGDKVIFEDGKIATYNFSNELRKFQWGAQFGASWRALNHFNVNADLTWGLNNIFNKDFKTVKFAMYPIYLTIGFGYIF